MDYLFDMVDSHNSDLGNLNWILVVDDHNLELGLNMVGLVVDIHYHHQSQ